jgi:ABC-type transport system involved in multi-copper enzyme maturation permease subunit
VNPLSEIGLILGRELRRNLKSAKGIFLFALSALGGTVTSLVATEIDRMGQSQLTGEQLSATRELFLTRMYGDPAMGKYLAQAPSVLLLILRLTVWLGPLVVALMGFDAVSGDLQQRSVRFWVVRMRRTSYCLGKFLGLWTAVSSVTLVMNLCVWGAVVVRHDASLGDALSWGLRFWAVSLPISAAWCGIATLVGSLFATPILSLLATLATFFAIWIVYAVGQVRDIVWLGYLYPNGYDAWLLAPDANRVALGALACFAFAGLAMTANAALFQTRDV